MRTTRKARIFALAASLAVASLFCLVVEDIVTSAKSAPTEAYWESRRIFLLRLLENAKVIPDESVRAIEIERIKDRLGNPEEHEAEIGSEATIDRFGN